MEASFVSCDAILPTAERYSSTKFRRVAQKFRSRKTDFWDACELVAFGMTVADDYATQRIFHALMPYWQSAYNVLSRHNPIAIEATKLWQQNLELMNEDIALSILRAMQDGGWEPKRGRTTPHWVKMLVLADRDRKVTAVDSAARLNLPIETIHALRRNPKQKQKVTGRGRAAAALALAG